MLFRFLLSDNNAYECTIKQNKRSKHARLRRTKLGELVLTLPKKLYYSKSYLTRLLQGQEDWIVKTLAEFSAIPKVSFPEPPTEITLESINENWRLEYGLCTGDKDLPKMRIDRKLSVLEFSNITSSKDVAKLVKKFMKQKAKKILEERITYCCQHYNLPLQNEKVRISFARTRWGSYTRKSLTLNARLICLPLELVDYVIVHELCHSVHLNHSAQFYALLEEKIPSHINYKKAIKEFKLEPFLWAL